MKFIIGKEFDKKLFVVKVWSSPACVGHDTKINATLLVVETSRTNIWKYFDTFQNPNVKYLGYAAPKEYEKNIIIIKRHGSFGEIVSPNRLLSVSPIGIIGNCDKIDELGFVTCSLHDELPYF